MRERQKKEERNRGNEKESERTKERQWKRERERKRVEVVNSGNEKDINEPLGKMLSEDSAAIGNVSAHVNLLVRFAAGRLSPTFDSVHATGHASTDDQLPSQR